MGLLYLLHSQNTSSTALIDSSSSAELAGLCVVHADWLVVNATNPGGGFIYSRCLVCGMQSASAPHTRISLLIHVLRFFAQKHEHGRYARHTGLVALLPPTETAFGTFDFVHTSAVHLDGSVRNATSASNFFDVQPTGAYTALTIDVAGLEAATWDFHVPKLA